jgi:uncharacterized protein (DUF1015 family)
VPKIEPFRGIHYDPLRTYGLSPVIGPPEDIPTREEIAEITVNHPYHALRLEFGNPDEPDPHDLRAEFLERWLGEGILMRDDRPAFYIHEQRFRSQGIYNRRLGLFAAAELTDDPASGFRPHEGTIPQNLAFRRDLLKRLRLSISPIFTLIRDGGWLGAVLSRTIQGRPPDLSGHDDEEGIHRVWKLEDPGLIEWLKEGIAGLPLYIADGHHRFTAAMKCRDSLRKQGMDPGPANFVMALIVSEFDPGVTILPIHRDIRTLKTPWPEVRREIERHFEVECALPSEDVEPEIIARRVERLSESDYPLPEFLLLNRSDPQLCRVRLKSWELIEDLVDGDQSSAVRELDVTVLHRVLIEHLLGIDRDDVDSVVDYSPDAEGIAHHVLEGDSELGIFVRTTRIEQVLAVADAGAYMPQKSTYFYPKVPAGLVMYDLLE